MESITKKRKRIWAANHRRPAKPWTIGERRIDGGGHIQIKTVSGVIYEHRLIAGAGDGEVVHHINGIKTDNRYDNLQVMAPEEHNVITLGAQLAISMPFS